jgi:hypothetical protein
MLFARRGVAVAGAVRKDEDWPACDSGQFPCRRRGVIAVAFRTCYDGRGSGPSAGAARRTTRAALPRMLAIRAANGNAQHDMSKKEVEEVFQNLAGEWASRNSGRPIAFGETSTRREIAVDFEPIDADTVRPGKDIGLLALPTTDPELAVPSVEYLGISRQSDAAMSARLSILTQPKVRCRRSCGFRGAPE